jgi:hypothetical protein
MPDKKITVIAYSGYRNDENPRAFILFDEEIIVKEILKRWIEEDFTGQSRKRFFVVKGSDGYTYKLYYDEKKKDWFLALKERI